MSISPETFPLLQQAVALRARGRLTEAEHIARAALHAAPGDAGARWVLGTVLLLQGRYGEGFELYEARHEWAPIRVAKPQLPYPEWNGEPVKRLLVWIEQGFGDQIQMARFAPMLAERMEVLWLCPPPLIRLFRQLPVTVIEQAPVISFDDPDAWVMPLGLPLRLGVSGPDDILSAPYFSAPSAPKLDGFNIGVCWRGNPQHPNDARRSMPSPEPLRTLSKIGALHDFTEPQGDFLDAARRIGQMDAIVTVDTAVAHLAGALGIPCFILLPAEDVDWRWSYGRDDTPWYRSVRLCRQAMPGDWASAVAAAARRVARLR
ncbi:hypothetical protein [Phenylobacterium sp.]|jgi:hypothetical protein|uniref:hypothetical protein n=1 Tax=Phenylobacterium sp. TaxID=1871053 RepID=UPI002E3478C3|nr:hypothetical protein [Phenylobacterium sp.]HEX2559501.1 hypothetical protein [Phenylobacterium sp.]